MLEMLHTKEIASYASSLLQVLVLAMLLQRFGLDAPLRWLRGASGFVWRKQCITASLLLFAATRVAIAKEMIGRKYGRILLLISALLFIPFYITLSGRLISVDAAGFCLFKRLNIYVGIVFAVVLSVLMASFQSLLYCDIYPSLRYREERGLFVYFHDLMINDAPKITNILESSFNAVSFVVLGYFIIMHIPLKVLGVLLRFKIVYLSVFQIALCALYLTLSVMVYYSTTWVISELLSYNSMFLALRSSSYPRNDKTDSQRLYFIKNYDLYKRNRHFEIVNNMDIMKNIEAYAKGEMNILRETIDELRSCGKIQQTGIKSGSHGLLDIAFGYSGCFKKYIVKYWMAAPQRRYELIFENILKVYYFSHIAAQKEGLNKLMLWLTEELKAILKEVKKIEIENNINLKHAETIKKLQI
ncbi:hypothetical protein ENBRE01_2421 [Enteropsectra breve]|nr:hypothetical protein ENBRE01_2421 [Enteropsectra breve]